MVNLLQKEKRKRKWSVLTAAVHNMVDFAYPGMDTVHSYQKQNKKCKLQR